MKHRLWIVGCLALVSASVVTQAAEPAGTIESVTPATPPIPTGTIETQAPSSSTTGQVEGWLDMRPSFQKSTSRLENEIGGMYGFGSRYKIGYVQKFWTQLSNYEGSQLIGDEGYLRFDAKDIWSSGNGAWALNFESRLVLPTADGSREIGFVSALRPRLELAYSPRPWVTLLVREGVVLPWYRSGAEGIDGRVERLDNRAEAEVAFSFVGGALSVRIPAIYQTRVHQLRPTAVGKQTASQLWIEPEITYAVSQNIAFGGGYYSAALIGEDLGLSAPDTGFKNGVWQMILVATL